MSRRPGRLGPEYQPPDDGVKKLMKSCWAVPFWGAQAVGPTGLVFFNKDDADRFLNSDVPVFKTDLFAIRFHWFARKREKTDWLDNLGLSALREDCSRTRVSYTRDWVPLLRQGQKPFGLMPNMVCDDTVKGFYVFDCGFKAHVFGDGFTLAQRREYAKKLGADIGLVEPLKGKGRPKGDF